MPAPFSAEQRKQEEVLRCVDDGALWVIGKPSLFADGRWQFWSIEDESRGTEYTLAFTSQQAAERCARACRSRPGFITDGFQVIMVGGKHPENLLNFLANNLYPYPILWDWDGRELKNCLTTPRDQLRRAMLGDETIWDRERNKPPLRPADQAQDEGEE